MTLASATTLWYVTRGSGVVALLLLTVSVLLGIGVTLRWRGERWPRFAVANVHKNLTLLSIVFVLVHVVTTVADGYAPISLTAAVWPFGSPYRPVWLGLGTVAFDLLLALVATSLAPALVEAAALARGALARLRSLADRTGPCFRHRKRRAARLACRRRVWLSRSGGTRSACTRRARRRRPSSPRRRGGDGARHAACDSCSGTTTGRRSTGGRSVQARRRQSSGGART